MGNLFARSRNTVDELEAIILKLDSLNTRCLQVQSVRYGFLWWLAVLTFLVTSAYTATIYLLHESNETKLQYFGLSWLGGILLFASVRYTTLFTTNLLVARFERQARELKKV